MLARLTDAYTISIVAVVDFALECPLLRVEMGLRNLYHRARFLAILMKKKKCQVRDAERQSLPSGDPIIKVGPKRRKEKGELCECEKAVFLVNERHELVLHPPGPPHPTPNCSDKNRSSVDRLHIVRRPDNQNTHMPPPPWPTSRPKRPTRATAVQDWPA